MTESDVSNIRRNKVLLIQILLLDLIGFSLIFPLVPDLLEFYLHNARTTPVDKWLIHISDFTLSLLPPDRRNSTNMIVLLGGFLSSIYSFLQFIFSPLWGRFSDRIGRRKVLILTSFGLAISYVLWVFSSSFTVFLISRIIGGMMAGNFGVATAAMADMSDAKSRTGAMGLIGAAFGVGFIIGPVIGGLSSRVDFAALFPDFPYFHPFSFCALLSFLLSIGGAVLNYTSFTETLAFRDRSGETEEKIWIFNPLKALLMLHSPGFYYLTAINFLYLTVFSGFEFTLTFFYKLDFGLSPYVIGFVFLYLGVIIAAGQGGLVRRLNPRFGEKKLIVVGLGLVPLPLYLLAHSAPHLSLSLFYLFPVALGSALVMPALTGLASLLSPEGHQGLALGVFRSSGSLARALGPIFGSYLYWISGIQFTYLLLAIALVLIVLLSLRINGKTKRSGASS